MIDTLDFYNCLCQRKMDFFAGVPDSLLKNLCACIKDKSAADHNIITANEGNAVATACGYHVATGKYGVVYMQNSGEGNAVNPLMSLADPDVYSIPMLLIIGWRGQPGVHDEPQHVKQGKVTLPLLETMGIDYQILDENYVNQIDKCYADMQANNRPVALVVRKGLFSDYKLQVADNGYPLSREAALKTVLSQLKDQDFVVSTTGKTSREIFELRQAAGQGHANDFLTVGSMGHTASIAFGMSIGTTKNVFCIDGDGSFIMHMGGFAVIGQNSGPNFKYILINNGAHESVGGQPTVALDIDVQAILQACGFKHVYKAETEQDIKDGISHLNQENKAALIIYCHQGSRADLGRPTTTPVENKEAFMKKMGA